MLYPHTDVWLGCVAVFYQLVIKLSGANYSTSKAAKSQTLSTLLKKCLLPVEKMWGHYL